MCTIVLSHLEYGNATLINLPISSLKPLQLTLNYTAKVSFKKQKYDSTNECLSALYWLPIHYRCIYKLMTIVYKILHESEPQYQDNKCHMTTGERMPRYNKSNSVTI